MSKFPARIALGLTFAIAASAASAETLTFSRDGTSYVAEVTQQANGVVKIVGHEAITNKPFTLYVKGDRVSGVYGTQKVAFATPDQPTQLSSR